ncbi:MAG: aminodeoxychorismate synthase component I [Umezawaea sp.]
MRTLLIDNHDSYTYNLFQLIAAVNGADPLVLRNDDPELSRLSFDDVDNVVISPGPGRPGRDRDLARSTRFLRQDELPVLGVCLGHQGLGFHAGAQVALAPQARHGHPTTITHNGHGLFAGIPQGFTAVRYHSLCVREPLPAELEATAWAEDDVLMGLRHRSRPQWGVQFHPESVLTEWGTTLLANFRRLSEVARPSISVRVPSAAPTAQVVEAPTRRTKHRLHTAVHRGAVDPEQVFAGLHSESRRVFWLDGAGGPESRFSYLGDDTGPLAEYCGYDVQEGVVTVERAGRPTTTLRDDIFSYLRRGLAQRDHVTPDLPFDFACGWVGYFGYELKAELGGRAAHRSNTPDAAWLFADRVIVIDHQEHTAHLLCLAEDTWAAHNEATAWLDATLAFLSALPSHETSASPARAQDDDAEDITERWLLREPDDYRADVVSCQKQLHAGESYEICLTTAVELPATSESADYYRVLRRVNPAPYSAYLRFGEVDVASSSPERFLRIGADGVVQAEPIKGTVARGVTPEQDAELRDGMAEDPKTRAENLMIVDLLRNDLGRVCQVGTVRVPELMRARTYETVHQLVSTVRGELRPGLDALDCVRACFPGGSMTGAPKERTMEIIDELEGGARGVYSGALGFLSCDGSADLSIVIRTAVFADGQVRIGAGGAIVLDSDPDAEFREMLLKLAAPMRAYWRSSAHRPAAVLPAERRGSAGRRTRRTHAATVEAG